MRTLLNENWPIVTTWRLDIKIPHKLNKSCQILGEISLQLRTFLPTWYKEKVESGYLVDFLLIRFTGFYCYQKAQSDKYQFPHSVLNWNVLFQALRNRAIQSRLNRKPLPCEIKPGSVIENVASTRRLAETALGPSTVEEQATNTGSGSGDEDEEVADADCHVISNDKSTEFILATVVEEAA